MGYYLEGNGYQVDGAQFKIYYPGAELETLSGCVSCKTSHTRLESQALWVDLEDTGYLIEICKFCAEDYYPEAVKINER
jgi:hypothetical protein